MTEFQLPPEAQKIYLNRRIKDYERMFSELDNPDFDFIKTLGHQIKGNADTFKFPELTPIAKKLESAAMERSVSALQAALLEFKDFVQNTQNKINLM